MKHFFTLLAVVLLLPILGQAQQTSAYTFSTGVDASKWHAPTTASTNLTLVRSYPQRDVEDEARSAVTNIGFSFPFCGHSYTQFSFSTNGRLRLGATQVSSNFWTPFDPSHSLNTDSADLPLISAWGVDGWIDPTEGHYVKYEVGGTAPNRVFYLTVRSYTSVYASYFYLEDDFVEYQIQLCENGTIRFVYHNANTDDIEDNWGQVESYQIGFAAAPTDVVTVRADNHALIAYTSSSSYNEEFPGANRYYEFNMPNISCAAPTGLAITQVTSNEVYARWNRASTSTGYNVKCVAANGAAQQAFINDTFYNFTGLTPNTQYTLTVTNHCSATDSSVAATTSFNTLCGAIQHSELPYHESFDSYSTASTSPINPCWRKYNFYSTYTSTTPYPSNSQHYGTTGNSLYFCHGYTREPCYAVLPLFDDSLYNLELSFQLLRNQSNVGMQVGVMVNPNDTSTFTPIASFAPTTTQWHLCEVNFEQYSGNGRYIAFRTQLLGGTYNYPIYLDEVDVHLLPTCPRLTNVAVDSVEVTTAYLSWNNSSYASHYIVEYDTAPFTPGSRLLSAETTYSNDVTLYNLLPSTEYYVYVHAICGLGDTSDYSYLTFRTACGHITLADLPLRDNFDSYTAGNNNPINPCWTKYNYSSTTMTYPYASTLRSSSAPNSLVFYHGYTHQPTYAVLPESDVPVNTMQLEFDVNITSMRVGIEVGVMTNPTDTSTFTTVARCMPTTSAQWQHFEVMLSSYVGAGHFVALRSTSENSSTGYSAYVDNLVVSLIPTCPRPTNFTVGNVTPTTATIAWHETGSAVNYRVDYDTVNFTAGNAAHTAYATGDTTITLTGLQANTLYYINVYAVCGSGDTSTVLEGTARTACGNVANSQLPYIENFNSYGTGATATINTCWVSYYGTPTNHQYPYPAATPARALTGASLYMNHGTAAGSANGNQPTYLILPQFDAPLSSLMLSFWLDRTHSQPLSIEVGIMQNPYDTSSFTTIGRYTPTVNSQWQRFETSFEQYNGTGQYIAFRTHYTGTSSMYQIYIDDITVEQIPGCPSELRNLTADVQSGEVTLQWQPSPHTQPLTYNITLTSETSSRTFTTTDTSYRITSLMPRTSYTARVEVACNAATARDSISFTTPCNGTSVTIGNTESTTSDNILPVSTYYKNSYTQQIVLASELNGAMDINNIAFQYAYTTPSTVKTRCRIFMGHVSRNSFNSSNSWVSFDSLQLVYTGAITATNGWNEIALDSTFQYNGTNNLVVAVLDSSNAFDGSAYKYVTTTTTTARSLYYRSDSSPFNTTSPQSGTTLNARCNMKLMQCTSAPVCSAPMIDLASISATTATVNIIDYDPTDTLVAGIRAMGSGAPIAYTTVNDSLFSFASLTPNSNYTVEIGRKCDDDTLFATLNIQTLCAPMNPRAVSIASGSATIAWHNPCEQDSSWQIEYGVQGFAHGEGVLLTVNDTTATLEQLSAGTAYECYVRASRGEETYSEWTAACLFNTLECPTVTDLHTTALTTNSASIAWTGAEAAQSYIVIYGQLGFTPAEGDTILTQSPAVEITGLAPETSYELYVVTRCDSVAFSTLSTQLTFSTEALSIPTTTSATGVNIYPNPATTKASIELTGTDGPVEITITDLNGREVKQFNIECSGACTAELPVSNLAQGLYLVRIKAGNKVSVARLIVQ